jgi:predicted CXXCH cytochrome family protein
VRTSLVIAWITAASLAGSATADVRNTKHNLSVSGPGSVVALTETEICVFCHTPHNASQTQGVLWNRADSTATYVPYDSQSLRAIVEQPNGASKLCLACHDGTVALGELLSLEQEVGFVGGVRFMPAGPGLIETDLSDDHPVSFTYDHGLVMDKRDWRGGTASGGLVDPDTLQGSVVRLDQWDQMQCTSCHDPHDDGFGKFLVAPMQRSELCVTCHSYPEWPASPHATSPSTWSGTPPDPWPHSDLLTVADNACQNCHRSHAAESTWLLNRAVEEDNCLVCHNGQLAATDIQSEMGAPFRHGVALFDGIHSPDEDATLPMTQHVECTDCHNPHELREATPTAAPLVPGSLAGASGIDSTGARVARASYEYEVCFKCHGDFPMTGPPVNRQASSINKRLQFDPGAASFHPVEVPGTNPNVPSLIPPYTVASIIYCGDCHANNAGPGAGGVGPAGPHGSIYPFLLERQYNSTDGLPYDPNLYAMCFKCHSEPSIRSDASFKFHSRHLEGTSCGACHDPHGVSASEGNPFNNSHLINFDLSVVLPEAITGRLEFEDMGTFSGQCYLQCHGVNHDPLGY